MRKELVFNNGHNNFIIDKYYFIDKYYMKDKTQLILMR